MLFYKLLYKHLQIQFLAPNGKLSFDDKEQQLDNKLEPRMRQYFGKQISAVNTKGVPIVKNGFRL